jgi:hypothetical protein
MLPLQVLSGNHILLILILIGAIIIYRAVIRPFRQGLKEDTSSKKQVNRKQAPNQRKETPRPQSKVDNSSPENKGKRFEEYVVRKFQAEKFYTLKEWRGDKYVDGIYPESNMYPDLELEFNIKDIKRRLAIECKYRSSMTDGQVEFAYPDQLRRYKTFEAENRIPVYILLGLEGTPESPNHLFLIPVSDIHIPVLTELQLQRYYKAIDTHFYYNLMDNTLN